MLKDLLFLFFIQVGRPTILQLFVEIKFFPVIGLFVILKITSLNSMAEIPMFNFLVTSKKYLCYQVF